jgi:hypothetical protein
MKKFILPVAALLTFVIAPSHTAAQSGKAAINEIDAYVKTVDGIVKRRRNPDRVFADTADMNSSREKWRRFASIKALDRFRKRSETYSISYNWLSAGKIVASNFTLFSASGDWAKYVNHYFRPDGTLARVDTDYRTFMGDFVVLRSRYFDPKGNQISSSVKYLDLTTRKPKDAGEGVMGDDPKEVEYYLKTSKLPFARLMK